MGALGGSFIFSDQYKYLLEGCKYTDSITINPHKLLAIPLQCSLFLIHDKNKLKCSIGEERMQIIYSKMKMIYHMIMDTNQSNVEGNPMCSNFGWYGK